MATEMTPLLIASAISLLMYLLLRRASKAHARRLVLGSVPDEVRGETFAVGETRLRVETYQRKDDLSSPLYGSTSDRFRRGMRIATDPPLPSGLTLVPPDLLEEMGADPGNVFRTGDASFDSGMILGGHDEAAVLAALDPEARSRILELAVLRGMFVVKGIVFFEQTPSRALGSPAQLCAVAADVARLFPPLDEPTTVDRLARAARTESHPGVRAKCLEVLARRFPDAPLTRETASAALEDADPEVRFVAAIALGPQAVPELLDLARSAPEPLRARAIQRLAGSSPDERFAAVLEQTFADGGLLAQCAAIAAFGQMRYRPAIPRLARMAETANVESAVAAAEALVAITGPEAEPTLLALLARGEPELRGAAARTLAEVGTLRAVQPLDEAARGEMGETAREAIRRIQSRAGNARPGQLAIAGPLEHGGLSLSEETVAVEATTPIRPTRSK